MYVLQFMVMGQGYCQVQGPLDYRPGYNIILVDYRQLPNRVYFKRGVQPKCGVQNSIWSVGSQEIIKTCHQISNFKAKMHQIQNSARALPQTPLGELTALPQTAQLDLRGLLLRRGDGRGGEERGGKEGRERMGRSTCLPPPFDHRCKKRFFTFFIQGTFLRFLTFFYFAIVFFIFKNVH